MKNIQFKKLVLSLGLLIFVLVYFLFKRDISRDSRIDVQAAHTCANDHFYGRCIYGCDAGYTCKGYPSCECQVIPTAVPTAGPTIACDTTTNTCDAAYGLDCDATCNNCPAIVTVRQARTKTGNCFTNGCRPYQGPCWEFDNIPDSANCGFCEVGTYTTPTVGPSPTWFCQPYTCLDSCTGYDWCSDGCGSSTNCGGVSCNSCSGVQATSTPGPTSTPGATPTGGCNCATESCRTNLCNDLTCKTGCGTYCYGSLVCNTPFLNYFEIKNSETASVTEDVNNRNHICEDIFSFSSNPRRIILEANVIDADGYTNIRSVEIRWAGIGYTMDFDNGAGNEALYTKTIDFGVDDNNVNTWPIEINITDANDKTTGWILTDRDFKVWDCSVSIRGTLYDGSAGQACDATGFSNVANSSLNYSTLFFRDSLGGGVLTTALPPFDYGVDNLIWGRDYLPIFNGGDVTNPNGDLSATARMIRIVDLGIGTTSCPTTDEFDIGTKVSAYSTSPAARIDFSFLRTQEGWFQVVGAGVKAKNQIGSGVPVTAPVAIRALTLSKALADNGLVSFTSFSNINGFNESSGYGLSNNWWINRNTNDSTTYNYQYFYNNLYVNRGLGTTGTDWISKPSEGIYYVNGNLTIDSNFTLAAGKTLLVVVRGTITISDTVDRIDGIFIADGGIIASGSSANQLVINGVLYSKGNIQLSRSYTNKVDNNDNSAVVVSYQPNLIFNLPGTVMRVLSGWKEE